MHRLDLQLRLSFDVVTAAAGVNAFALHPRRVPGARLIGTVVWAVALAFTVRVAVLEVAPPALLA